MPNQQIFQPDLDDLDYDQILGQSQPQQFEPDLTDFDYERALADPDAGSEGYWTAAINEFFKPQTDRFSQYAKSLTDPHRNVSYPGIPDKLRDISLGGIDLAGRVGDQLTSSGDLTSIAMTLAGLGAPAAGLRSLPALNALSKGVKFSNLLPIAHGGTGVVTGKTLPEKLGGALEAGLGVLGYRTAKPILPRGAAAPTAEAVAGALTPEQLLEQEVAKIVESENLAMRPPAPAPQDVGSYVSRRTLKNPRQLTIPYRGQVPLGESPIPEIPPDWDSALGRNAPPRPTEVPIEQPIADDFVEQIETPPPEQMGFEFEQPTNFREVIPEPPVQPHPMDDVIPTEDFSMAPPARPMAPVANAMGPRPMLPPEFNPDMLMGQQPIEGGYSPTFTPRGIPDEVIPEQAIPEPLPNLDVQPLPEQNIPESWTANDYTVGQEDWPSTAWKQQLDELDAVGAPDEAYASITGGRGVPGQSQRDRVLSFIEADIKGRTEIAREESVMRRMFSGDPNAPLMEKEDLVESMLRDADEGVEEFGTPMPPKQGPIEVKKNPDGTFDMNDPTTARIVNMARGGRPPTMAERISPAETVKMPVEDLPKDASLKYIKREMRRRKPPKHHKTFGEKGFWGKAGDIASISRAIQSSYDLSMPFRQGLGLIHTKGWWNALKAMGKTAIGKEKAYNAVIESIEMSPNYRLGKAMGLNVTDLGELASREEEFGAAFADKIPGIGWSNRAASAFMNKLRMDTFDSLMASAEKGGLKPRENGPLMKSIANYINNASGRGSFKKQEIEKSMEVLNNLFFSPRLIKARMEMLNPRNYAMGDKFVRKQYLKSIMSLGGAWLTFSGLAKAAGAEVAPMDDPSTANFGRIRWGNTRIDPTGGMLPYINLLWRLGRGVKEFGAGEQQTRYGGRVVDPTPFSDAGEFLFNKTAPVPRLLFDALRAQQWRPFYLGDEAARMVTPIIAQDILELADEDRDWAKHLSIPILSAIGFGTNTYVEGKPSRMFPENWFPPESDKRFPAMTPQMQRRLQAMRRRGQSASQ